jgi:hypothetical protein
MPILTATQTELVMQDSIASTREYHARCVEITQAEVQALRDKAEELTDDVRAFSA